jgi:uncharacterized protein YcbX
MMRAISLINLSTVRAIEEVCDRPVNLLRFRANIYIDGPPAWTEADWKGYELTLGTVRLSAVADTTRCAATEVAPQNRGP